MARVLAVDDDAKIRDLLDTLLRRKGHQVLTADHGQKGIDVFRRERPDITILDLKMPNMNGIEVLRKIREINPQAPVIILTGAGTETFEKQARDLGVTHFLEKGFSLHELGDALNRMMQERGLAASEPPSSHGSQRPVRKRK
ncbi:MAG: response regulator [Nitrospirae bacterium]|nr:MAG: response regulator [Nitrospirota bacterium]